MTLARLSALACAMSLTAMPVPAAQPCAAGEHLARADRLQAALSSGFGIQYWGRDYSAAGLGAAPHGLLIVEAARIGAPDSADGREVFFTPAEIAAMQRGGRPVLVYLNLTELEPWRDYWPADGRRPAFLGPETQAGERLAAWWTEAWREVLFDRIDRLAATGADGVFLDDSLHYYTTGQLIPTGEGAPQDVPAAAVEMMRLVRAVTDRLRSQDCRAMVVVNNAVFVGRDAGPERTGLFDAYRTAIDGVLIEDSLGAADHPDLHTALAEDYLASDLSVLSVDFAPDGPRASLMAKRAQGYGYAPYIVPDGAFSSLSVNRPTR